MSNNMMIMDPINWFDCVDGNKVWIYQVNDGNWDCPNGKMKELIQMAITTVLNNEDNCPNTPENEVVDATGCSESQIREEFQAEEITSLHYSIEMYNLTHGVIEEERYRIPMIPIIFVINCGD